MAKSVEDRDRDARMARSDEGAYSSRTSRSRTSRSCRSHSTGRRSRAKADGKRRLGVERRAHELDGRTPEEVRQKCPARLARRFGWPTRSRLGYIDARSRSKW